MHVVITPELVAAIAATVAAILSGIALWLGGAREERKWRRDALVDTVVQFLDASFAGPGTSLLDKRRDSTLTDQDLEKVDEVHRASLTALTRLRVLASTKLVACAEELHGADDYAYDIVLGNLELPDREEWDAYQTARWNIRHSVLDAARRDLGLGKAKFPDPKLFGSSGPDPRGVSEQP
jgi:hypothetical protein